jgi:hypothetical protein
LLKRKGAKTHKWEQVVCLNEAKNVSPWHLIMEYVKRTCGQGKPGGPLLIALKKPFKALTADRVASLTKEALGRLGVDTRWWSTRGAGVAFYRRLGLSGEEVCEIGQ